MNLYARNIQKVVQMPPDTATKFENSRAAFAPHIRDYIKFLQMVAQYPALATGVFLHPRFSLLLPIQIILCQRFHTSSSLR